MFTASVALQNRYGVPSRMIDPAEAQRISPLIGTEGLLAASWSPDDATCTPEAVVSGYAAAARRHGACLIRNCPVVGVETSGGAITAVVTEHGAIRTPTVVCAAGAWSGLIGAMVGVTIPVTPVRRQIAFTAALAEPPRRAPLTIDFPSSFYFHPEGDGLLIGWSDPDQAPGFNLTFELEDWLAGLAGVAATRAPAVLDLGIASGWAGLYEVTPDRNQIIDRCDEVEGLLDRDRLLGSRLPDGTGDGRDRARPVLGPGARLRDRRLPPVRASGRRTDTRRPRSTSSELRSERGYPSPARTTPSS